MKFKIVLTLLFIFSISSAQVKLDDIVLGKIVRLQSIILNEERPILVYTPPDYNTVETKYPVLYVLDGGAHYLHTCGILQILSRSGRIPQMIVIAVPNTNRNRDFTPTRSDDLANSGGADKFLAFLKDELIPFVNKKYRTQPYSILFGHSLTGMFNLYTIAKERDLFNAFIVASPYLMYDNEIVLKSLESFLKDSPEMNHSVYITIGNEPDYFDSLDKLSVLFNSYTSENFRWKYVKMENEDHASIPHKTIYDGLEFIFSDWRISANQLTSRIDAIEKHYANLSERFGYEIKVPEFLLNQIGYRYLNQNLINEAIAIFLRNIENYPNSANVYDSMGDAYTAAGQYENARKNYAKAIERATVSADPNLPIYKKNLAKVENKISE
jgi:predicted alpha/beta superfamily hydrolase